MRERISVIVPVYNEEKLIASFVQHLEERFTRCEIILVDGGSTDKTLKYLERELSRQTQPGGNTYQVLTGAKGRAVQMNLGAEHSTGEILFFLHCDSILPEQPEQQIRTVMQKFRAGCFGIVFESENFWMKCCQYLSDRRVRKYGIMFGDQGIFIEKGLFLKVGGFPELPIMEDYQLSLTLQKNKVRTGLTEERIRTSDRRFASGGRLRVMWQMNRLRAKYRRGEDINEIARRYLDIR